MMKPAVRHVIVHFANHFGLDRLSDLAEDISWLTTGIIEACSLLLQSEAATVMESLYGLIRVSTSNAQLPLHQCQRVLSIAYFLLVPKLIKLLQSLRPSSSSSSFINSTDSSSREQPATLVEKTKRFLVQFLYQFIFLWRHTLAVCGDVLHITEQIVTYCCRLGYLSGWTSYHHPIFALLRMKLVKKKHLSTMREPSPAAPPTSPDTTTSSNGAWALKAIAAILLISRMTAWYTQQDLSEHNINRKIEGDRPIPPPPKQAKVIRGGIIPPSDKTLCPICSGPRVDPCATTSGMVYCYLCILEVLREKGQCPVTGIPCKEEDLLRIFDSA